MRFYDFFRIHMYKLAMSAAFCWLKIQQVAYRKGFQKITPIWPCNMLSTGGCLTVKATFFTEREKAAMVECLVWRRGIEFSEPNFLKFAGAMAKSKGLYHWNYGNFLSCGRTFWNLYFQTPESTEMVWQDPLYRQRMQKYFQALRIKILFQTFTINHARSGTWMKLGWRLAINQVKYS